MVDLKDINKPDKTGGTAGSIVEEEVADRGYTHNGVHGIHVNSGETGDEARDDDSRDPLSDKETQEEDISTTIDDGESRSRNVFNLLGMNMLDEPRLLRIQEGFLKLLEQY